MQTLLERSLGRGGRTENWFDTPGKQVSLRNSYTLGAHFTYPRYAYFVGTVVGEGGEVAVEGVGIDPPP